MPLSKKLKSFLDENNIKYVAIKHSLAYTAQEVAASLHVPGDLLAKSVIVKIDGAMAMVVLPSSYRIDFLLLKEALGCKKVELASEREFNDQFPDCEPGAMPPFGNLYDLPVYVAQSLAKNEEIVFNACTHQQVIRMNYSDYEKLAQPTVLKLSEHL